MPHLYVIGNGFDLHHGMRTRYWDFAEFLKHSHPELRDLVDEYFPTDDDDFWSCFEENLASFDADSLESNSEDLIVPYGSEEWSDAFHHDYGFELERVVKALSEDLLGAFAEWVRKIDIPSRLSAPVLLSNIDPTARFISFNYTNTLQKLYGVCDSNVWHIHGSATGSGPLVLGHGWQRKPMDLRSSRLDPESEDTRVIEGAGIIDSYFERTFKPTAKILDEGRAWFEQLSDIDSVRVMGHSLSEVDQTYLRRIATSTGPTAQWRISFFGSSEGLEVQCAKFGLHDRVTFWPMSEV